MRVISNKALTDFARLHPAAATSLQAWRKVVETQKAPNFAALKALFNAVDKVGDYFVFDIGGNKVRLVAQIHFNRQVVYIRHVFTHPEYDRWNPRT